MTKRDRLLEACKEGLRLGEIAVRLGLHGFSDEEEDDIVANQASLKMIREAIADAEAVEDPQCVYARRWQALLNCKRIRIIGSAGFSGGLTYRHLGLEIWTEHDKSTVDALVAQQLLTEFADTAIAIVAEVKRG